MKKNILLAIMLALAVSTLTAGPAFYNITVASTQTATLVTPTAANGKATFVRIMNDSGAYPVYVDFDRTAVAASSTAVKIGLCEGRDFVFDASGITTLSVINDTGQTASVRVQVHYMKGTYPTGLPTQSERLPYFTNAGCAAAASVATSDLELTAIAGLTSATNKGITFTGSGTASTFDLTAAALTVLDDSTVGAMLDTQMAGTSTTVTAAAKTVLDDTTVAAMVDTLGGASSVGTGGIARANTPILVTPAIGAATGASVVLTGAVTAPGGFVSLASQGQTVTKKVTLTEAGAAEIVATFTSAAGSAFSVHMEYLVFVGDSTPDYAARVGSLEMVCVNKATTVACTKDATSQADDESQIQSPATSKTLTYAIAVGVGSANVATISFDIDSDIGTVVGGYIVWTATVNGTVTIS